MHVDLAKGLVAQARQLDSPNQDERPDPQDVSLLVIHGISLPPGQYGGPYIDQLFLNTLDPEAHPYFRDIQGLRVSSHLLIRRDGELVQYVPLHKRAWHAGLSRFEGRERCNDFAIGIELEGTDHEPYSDAQYECLQVLIEALLAVYPRLAPERIVGHSDIAPGRKSDPGSAFDWERLQSMLA